MDRTIFTTSEPYAEAGSRSGTVGTEIRSNAYSNFINFATQNVVNARLSGANTIDRLEVPFKVGSSSSSENQINESRESALHETVSPRFLRLLRDEEFEFGCQTESEEVISEQLRINALATRNWLNQLFVTHFHDPAIVAGILRLIGRFSEFDIFPQGYTMALSALNHKNKEIQELGIRAFEEWGSAGSLYVLKQLNSDTKWIQDYIDEVIADLESIYGVLSQEV